MKNYLEQIKLKCIAKSKELAILELSIWNDEHESALIRDFGFTTKTVKERK